MSPRSKKLSPAICLTLAIVVALNSCGDSSTDPPASGIGANGGTVTGPSGSQVVIPAGALSANTAVTITQSGAGAPNLPGGIVSYGAMFTLAPHGTQFAVPVTLTLPFNPALVPAGKTPALYKTNAQNQWQLVPNATFGATSVTAQISGFSVCVIGTTPEIILFEPNDVTVLEGATATFTVVGGIAGPFTFQWQESTGGVTFTNIAGATSDVYTTPQTSIANYNGHQYRVLVTPTTLAGVTDTSRTVLLTVNPIAQSTFTVTVTVVGAPGSGTVTSTPAGIVCPGDCSEAFPPNTIVSLFPAPNAGFMFFGWSGDAACTTPNTPLTANRACTATFSVAAPTTAPLSVTVNGNGRVQSQPAGIDCPGDCSENYPLGNNVTLTPTPGAGSQFNGWSGDPDCNDGVATMSAARNCIATFGTAPGLPLVPGSRLAAGQTFSIAQLLTGQLRSWGADDNEQLGAGAGDQTRTAPGATAVPDAPTVISIAAGGQHGLAVRGSGEVVGWGYNGFGQLATGAASGSVAAPVTALFATGGIVSSAVGVCGGTLHSLILRSAAPYVVAMGYNGSGQLGDGTNDTQTRAVPVSPSNPLGPTQQIACGDAFSVALVNGAVFTWGANESGQLGNSSTSPSNLPVAVVGLPTGGGVTVLRIAAGKDHALALLSNGEVWGWGSNRNGKLGPGGVNPTQTTAIRITGLPAGIIPTAIAAGDENSAAVINGQVYMWGTNQAGQLGRGSLALAMDATPGLALLPLPTGSPACQAAEVAIGRGAFSGGHVLARCTNGAVYAWGNNSNGQLGPGVVGAMTATPTVVINGL